LARAYVGRGGEGVGRARDFIDGYGGSKQGKTELISLLGRRHGAVGMLRLGLVWAKEEKWSERMFRGVS